MSSFTEPLIVRKISAHIWQTEREFSYHVGSKESKEVITVPAGFQTDFASVPRGLWNIFPPDGQYTQAAVLHDYLYFKPIYTRCKSDRIFYEAMGVLGVPQWKRSIMFIAVRTFAWLCWKKRRKKNN